MTMHPKYARLVRRSVEPQNKSNHVPKQGLFLSVKKPFFLKPKFLRRGLGVLILLVAVSWSFQQWIPASKAFAAPWSQTHGSYGQRKQLTLVNNSGQTFESGTTYKVTIDTASLYNSGSLLATCDDLRVVYQPSNTTATELKRAVEYASSSSGVTTCATSSASKVVFQLQANIANAATDANYYIYYDNATATTYPAADALAAYNVGSKTATFVAPFNGTTTALAAGSGTPTTATGAIRYSGGKSALSFSKDYVDVNHIASTMTAADLTVEFWVNIPVATGQSCYSGGNSLTAHVGNFTFLSCGEGSHVVWGIKSTNQYIRGVGGSLIGQWHHIAMVRNSTANANYLYIDGVQKDTDTYGVGAGGTHTIMIGRDESYATNQGFTMDEFRISETARYTSNFTPSITPFVRDEYTKLLLHFDESGDDPRNTGKAIDDSGNGNHGTITGAKYVGGLVGVDGSSSNTSNQSYAGHDGVFIEEGTNNKITNPSFDHTTYNTNWSSPAVFDYDSSSDTFTAGMAKRNSAGPFASGVLGQGKWSDATGMDSITYPTGTAISGYFYPTTDLNQGSLVFWITPEWAGNDGKYHMIWRDSSGQNVIYHSNGNVITFLVGGSGVNVDTASWTAGTTYTVVGAWDVKNKLDGTNYVCLTINGSRTCGGTSAPTLGALASNVNIIGGANYGSDSLIEGFTIYRRPLFDGTYGVDAGNGNEIAKIYDSDENNGNGITSQDPTLVTGSWDVVFALPTNSSTGSLATGTGNAWSHPHASNLLYTSTTNTGGFMMNGTYTTDSFADVGTPTSVGALATGEKIYAGGYKYTSDAANEGIYRSFTATNGGDYVLRAMGHSDGTCAPQIKITRADGTTEITHLNGTTTSTRTAPNVYVFTWESPAAESEQVQLINTASSGTCYWHQVEVLPNSISNPSMETGSGNPWIPSGFYNMDLDTGDTSQETSIVHSGTASWKWNSGAQYSEYAAPSVGQTAGLFYSTGAWAYGDGTRRLRLWFTNNYNLHPQHVGFVAGGQYSMLLGSAATWQHSAIVFRAQDTFPNIDRPGISSNGDSSPGNRYIDDHYRFALSPVSLTVTPASEANSLETSGLRVDGTDTLTQTIDSLSATSGTIKFKFTPRHSFSIANSFGNTYPQIIKLVGDSNDFIQLYKSGVNLDMSAQFNGTAVSGSWVAPTLNANTTYSIEISYTSGGSLKLIVDGTERITSSGVVSFSTTPTVAWFGSDNAASSQYDGTFASPDFSGTITATENTTAPYYKFGSKSAKLVASADGRYVTSINPGNTNTHTFSAYVYDGTTGNVGGTVSATIAKMIFNGNVVTPASYTDMGGGWWRLSYSAAAANAAGDYGIAVLFGKTIYVDGVQLEDRYYATTYADGSLGNGYSWSGSAYDSSSTRNSGDLIYSASNNIVNTQGSFSLWLKPNWNGNDGYGHTIVDTSPDPGCGYLRLYKTSSSALRIYDGCSNYASIGASWSANTWQHVVGVWGTNNLSIYVNGIAGTASSTFNLRSIASLYIGRHINYTESGNVISDFKVFASALTSTEVADLYYSGLGSHSSLAPVATERYTDGEPPVLAWHLNEGYGTTAYDSSIFQNSGTTNGSTWSNDSGQIGGKSLKFDGINDFISRAYANDTELNPGTSPFSVSTWFKHPSTVSGTDTLISRYSSAGSGGGYKVYMNSSGFICFGVDDDTTWGPDDSACTTVSYADSNWHHVLAIKGTSTIAVYIDGTQKTSTVFTVSSSLSGASPTFFTGIDSDGASNPWDGFIDEVRVYNSARSEEQINQEYIAKGTNKGASVILGNGATPESLSNGLVGHWKMDEASWNGTAGEVLDASGNGNNGVRSGDATTTAGKYGNGGTFDGTGDYATIADSSSLDSMNNLTLSTWINMSQLPSTNYVPVGKDSTGTYGYRFTIVSGGIPHFVVATDSNAWYTTGTAVSAPTALTAGLWYQLTGVYDGRNVSIYINGQLSAKSNSTISGNIVNSASMISLGRAGDNNYYYNGKIDETRIYNRALSTAEVRALYEYAQGPVAHYTFDEGSGQSAYDKSGNSRTGTLGASASPSSDDPQWTNGKYGKALSFDGGDDVVSIANFSYMNAQTVSAWVYPLSSHAGDVKIYAHANAFACGINGTDNKVEVARLGGSWTFGYSSSALDIKGWNYVTCVYDGDYLIGYLNGVPGTPVSLSNTYTGSTTSYVGALAPGSQHIDSVIDDLKIYNYARTQKQIVMDMNAGHPAVGSPVGSAIAHYKFDEGQGTTARNSGNGGSTLNGTLTNMSAPATSTSGWTNDGKFNKALNFDGSDDSITINNQTLGTTDQLTISGWIKHNGKSSANQDIVVKRTSLNNDQFEFMLSSTYNLTFDRYLPTGGSVNSASTIPLGQWKFVTVTLKDTENEVRFYIDGKLDSIKSYTETYAGDSTSTLTIGRSGVNSQDGTSDPWRNFNGSIDEVKIYNYALSEDEVKLEYNQGKAIVMGSLGTTTDGKTASNARSRAYCPPGDTTVSCAPKGEWLLNENKGNSSVYDTSGNGYIGTLENMEVSDWIPGKLGSGLSFDGDLSDLENISLGDISAIDGDTGLTFEAWVKPNFTPAEGTDRYIFGFGNQLLRFSQSRDDFAFSFYDEGGSQTTLATEGLSWIANTWHHIAGVFDGANMYIYWDGVLQNITAKTGVAKTYTGAFRIGSNAGGVAASVWLGSLDDLRWYDYARTPAQIAWDYNKGAPLVQYKFNECSGSTINNSVASANGEEAGNNGTLIIGASLPQTSAGTCSSGNTAEAWNNGTSGKISASISFDGVDDYVSTPDSDILDLGTGAGKELTLVTWYMAEGISTAPQGIIAKRTDSSLNSDYMFFTENNLLYWGTGTSNDSCAWQSIAEPSRNIWHNVVGTLTQTGATSGNKKLYIDGLLKASCSYSQKATAGTDSIRIGSMGTPATYYFKGKIDDVRIYNYALSPVQVRDVYNNGAVSFK